MSTPMTTPMPIEAKDLIFHKTHQHTGRHLAVTPSNSSMKHLHYGRIRLDASTPAAQFDTGTHETGLICLSGTGTVKVGDATFELNRYDAHSLEAAFAASSNVGVRVG